MSMKKFLTLALLCFISIVTYGATNVGDLSYNTSGSTASVYGTSGNSATDIVIPETVEINGSSYVVTSIDGDAFNINYEHAINSLVIPATVTSIGNNAFKGQTTLTTITCYAVEPPSVGTNVFWQAADAITIYVPAESVSAYEAEWVWPVGQYEGTLTFAAIGDEGTTEPDPEEEDIYYLEPTNGSEVTSLSSFNLMWNDNGEYNANNNGVGWLDMSAAGWSGDVTNDGGDVVATLSFDSYIRPEDSSSAWDEAIGLKFDYSTTITDAGTYSVTIPSGMIRFGETSHGSLGTYYEDIVITYTIKGDEAGVQAGDVIIYDGLAYTVNDDLTTVTVAVQSDYADQVTIPSELVIPETITADDGTELTVTILGAACFGGAGYTIPSVVLPATITEIGARAFYRAGVETVTCYATTPPTMVANGHLSGCTIYVPCESVSLYEEANNWSDNTIIGIDCPEEDVVTVIDGIAYHISNGEAAVASYQVNYEGTTLTGAITIPVSIEYEGNTYYVTSIEDSAYDSQEGLTSVDCQAHITSVGARAFYHCYGMESFYIYEETVPTAAGTSFYGINDSGNCTLYVPDGMTRDYGNAQGWAEFTTRKDMSDAPEPTPEPTTFEWTVDPAEGVVEGGSLSTIYFACETGVFNEDMSTASDIKVYKDDDDEAVTYAKSVTPNFGTEYDYGFTITLNDELTEAGEYKVVIPEGFFYFFVDGRDGDVANDEITLVYTIEGTEEPSGEHEGDYLTPEIMGFDMSSTGTQKVTYVGPSGTEYNTYLYISGENFRFNGTTNCIYNSTSVGYLRKVIVTTPSDATGYTLIVQGSDEPLTYNYLPSPSTYGEALGSIVQVPGESATLEIEGDYRYFSISLSTGYSGYSSYPSSIELIWELEEEEPEADPNALTFNPADGETLTELSVVQITCPNGCYALDFYDWDVFDEEENKITEVFVGDAIKEFYDEPGIGSVQQTIGYNLELYSYITTPGKYHFTIPAGYFTYGAGSINEDITLTYTVVSAGYSLNPSNGSNTTELTTISITADDGEITLLDEDAEIVVTNREGTEITTATASIENGVLVITLVDEITDPQLAGEYHIAIPGGLFSCNGITNEELNLVYYVNPDVEYSLDPEDGEEVKSLTTITVGYHDGVCVASGVKLSSMQILNTAGDVVTSVASYDTLEETYDGDDYATIYAVVLNLADSITTEGTYTLNIPRNTLQFYVGMADDGGDDEGIGGGGVTDGWIDNNPITATYIVSNSAIDPADYVLSFDPANGEEVESLDEIKILCDKGIYVNVEDTFNVTDTNGTIVSVLSIGEAIYEVEGDESSLVVGYNCSFSPVVSDPGTYSVSFVRGEFLLGSDYSISSAQTTLSYTVAGEKEAGTTSTGTSDGFTYTVTPGEGEVESLSSIYIGCETGVFDEDMSTASDIKVYKDGDSEPITTALRVIADQGDDYDIGFTIVLSNKLIDEGDYKVVIPAGFFSWLVDGNENDVLCSEITLNYIISKSGDDSGDSGDSGNDDLYEKLCEEIAETNSYLDDTWSTIVSSYPDAANTLLDRYNDLAQEIAALQSTVDTQYEEGRLEEEVDADEAEIAAIREAIAQLLADAQSDTTGLYKIGMDYSNMNVYTLGGQKINAPTMRGVYIIDGKKVLVK